MAKNKPEISAFPKTPDGGIDRSAVKDLFDQSPHIEWTPFAQSLGWDPVISRATFPTARWIKEKRFREAKKQAELLADTLHQNKPKITEDILRTLRDYPAAHDKFLKIIEAQRAILEQEIAQHIQRIKNGGSPRPRKGIIGEILALTMALERVSSSKYKSLLLTDLTVKGIETQAQEQINEAPVGDAPKENTAMEFEVIGWENITEKQLEDLYHQYLDPPIRQEPALEELPGPENP